MFTTHSALRPFLHSTDIPVYNVSLSDMIKPQLESRLSTHPHLVTQRLQAARNPSLEAAPDLHLGNVLSLPLLPVHILTYILGIQDTDKGLKLNAIRFLLLASCNWKHGAWLGKTPFIYRHQHNPRWHPKGLLTFASNVYTLYYCSQSGLCR